jgi:1,4-dihydroxy-2-naphthoyl-CoA hydrolase
MNYTYYRTIYFKDTDGAGVVYFANVLSICHESYENSLADFGINLKSFFSNPQLAIPITHANIDFYQPLYCGQQIKVLLYPQKLTASKFHVNYEIMSLSDIMLGKAHTNHVCINPSTRTKIDLPKYIDQWLKHSNECD